MAKKSLRKNIEINPIFARPGEVTSAPADRFSNRLYVTRNSLPNCT